MPGKKNNEAPRFRYFLDQPEQSSQRFHQDLGFASAKHQHEPVDFRQRMPSKAAKDSLIPCEVCGRLIEFAEYADHTLIMHNNEHTRPTGLPAIKKSSGRQEFINPPNSQSASRRRRRFERRKQEIENLKRSQKSGDKAQYKEAMPQPAQEEIKEPELRRYHTKRLIHSRQKQSDKNECYLKLQKLLLEKPKKQTISMSKCKMCGMNVSKADRPIHHQMHKEEVGWSLAQKFQEEEMPTSKDQLMRVKCTTNSTLESCEICLEDFIEGSEMICLPCVHKFHQKCIFDWIDKNPVCPNCQKDIFKH